MVPASALGSFGFGLDGSLRPRPPRPLGFFRPHQSRPQAVPASASVAPFVRDHLGHSASSIGARVGLGQFRLQPRWLPSFATTSATRLRPPAPGSSALFPSLPTSASASFASASGSSSGSSVSLPDHYKPRLVDLFLVTLPKADTIWLKAFIFATMIRSRHLEEGAAWWGHVRNKDGSLPPFLSPHPSTWLVN